MDFQPEALRGAIRVTRQKGYAGTLFHTQILRGAYAGYASQSHSPVLYSQVNGAALDHLANQPDIDSAITLPRSIFGQFSADTFST